MLNQLKSFARKAACTTAIVAGVVMGAGSASAEDVVELRFSHWFPPTHPMVETGFKDWTESVEKASNGSIKITTYPAQQLGKALDHYSMAQAGIADIVFINPGLEVGRYPIQSLVEMPFLFGNSDAGTKAADAWYRKYAATEMADVHYCMMHILEPNRTHSKKELRTPEDYKGLRIRAPSAHIANFMTELGASNVNIPAPEARDALERGVADAVHFPWQSLMTFGLQDVVTHHKDVPLFVSGFVLLLNTDAYDRMSAAQKEVIDSHCTSDWAVRFGSGWNSQEQAGKAKIEAIPGHTIYTLNDEEIGKFAPYAETVLKQAKAKVSAQGVDADAAFKELVDGVAAAGALLNGEKNIYAGGQ